MNRLDLRAWLLLGMGLAGMLTVALIVTADESAAGLGVDGLRSIVALVPAAEQDHPDAAAPVTSIPLIGGLVTIVRDFAPSIFGVSTGSSAPDPASPADASPRPANSPSSSVLPTAPEVPAVQQPSAATPPPATPSPSRTSTPTRTPAPTTPPSLSPFVPNPPAPTASPSPTPTPMLAITIDRGATAIVNLAGLIPGDTVSRTITVTNSGSLGFRYAVSASQTASTALWTDTANGIQLTVSTTGGTVLYSGPLAGLSALAGPTTLPAGSSETLRYDFAFPASAPNSFQGLLQDLTLVFDAVQFP